MKQGGSCNIFVLKMENGIRIPTQSLLQSLYMNIFKTLRANVIQKLRDSNSMRSNLANPHERTLCITDVAQLVFAGVYGSKMLTKEKCLLGVNLSKSSPIFKLKTVEGCCKYFVLQLSNATNQVIFLSSHLGLLLLVLHLNLVS